MSEPQWMRELREKLDALRVERVRAADPEMKFRLNKLIEECETTLADGQMKPGLSSTISRGAHDFGDGPKLDSTKLLGGRYQLLHRLSSSPFAEVWGAFDRSKVRPVAIKLFNGSWSSDSTLVERFGRGVIQIRKLDHPTLLPILEDAARSEDGLLYYPMRWVLGGNLQARSDARSITPRESFAALARALSGLQFVHENRLVHRNVKPSNILLDDDNRGWLADFDIIHGDRSSGGTVIASSSLVQMYVAPETPDDGTSNELADVFSGGMCVLFILGQRTPTNRDLLKKDDYFKKLKGGALAEAARKAINFEPGERGTCRDLVAALEEHIDKLTPVEPNQPLARLIVPLKRPPPPRQDPRPDWATETGRDRFGSWATLQVGGARQRMRKLEAGKFEMGSPETEPGRAKHEGPRHTVIISHEFWLADTPCTQEFWQEIKGENPSYFKSPGRPVENISWYEVQLFIGELMGRGIPVALPTEAQGNMHVGQGPRARRMQVKWKPSA